MTTLFLMMLYSTSLLGGNWTAYVTELSNSLVPINLSTNTPGTAFPGVVDLINPVITPDGTTLYVSVSGSNEVAVFNLVAETLITMIPASSPAGMAITPDGAFVYVVNQNPGGLDTITKIDVATNTVATVIPTGSTNGNSQDIAITPDGLHAYIVKENDNLVIPIDLTTDVVGAPILVEFAPVAIAITPNGETAYVVNSISNSVTPITIATNMPGPSIPVGADPLGIAITSDGTTVYVTNGLDGTVSAISTATNMVIATIPVGASPYNVAITPDSKFVYVTNGAPPGDVVIIETTTNTVVGTISFVNATTGIAISPDQAPTAAFNFTSPNTFDASQSVSPVGSIASYFWDFGDGTTLVTTSPIVTHNYAVSGMYSIRLTVTNTAGTSTTQTYTGHMIGKHGGLSATITEIITVINPSPVSPSHFAGKIIENKFATQTDIIHRLKWIPSSDPSVVEYQLFRNGKLIAVIPASGPFIYLDHNRREHVPDTYILIAITASGVQSLPVIAVVD